MDILQILLLLGFGKMVSWLRCYEHNQLYFCYFILATIAGNQGVWKHSNGVDLPFINHMWTCGGTDGVFRYFGREYLLLGIDPVHWTQHGVWCDEPGDSLYNFICEK